MTMTIEQISKLTQSEKVDWSKHKINHKQLKQAIKEREEKFVKVGKVWKKK